jgi:hypothetical protein
VSGVLAAAIAIATDAPGADHDVSRQCDGQRPKCTRCATNETACEYISKSKDETQSMALKRELQVLRRELDEHTLLLQEIRRRPLPEATAIMRRLRSTYDIATILSAVHSDLPRNYPSEQRAARAVLPPTNSELEFELKILHTWSTQLLNH